MKDVHFYLKESFTADAILNVNKVVNESFLRIRLVKMDLKLLMMENSAYFLAKIRRKESVSPVRLPRSWDLPYRCRLCYQKGLVIAVTMI